MQDFVKDFIENNDVEFRLVAIVNGEEIFHYESSQSFDDVTGFSGLADDTFDKYVINNEEDRLELEKQRQEDLLEDEKDRAY